MPSMSTGCAVHGEQEGAMLGISLVTLVSGAVDVAELVGRIQGMLEDSHCQGVWEAAGYLGQAEAQAVLLLSPGEAGAHAVLAAWTSPVTGG